jgi:hypothetical protein
MNDFVGMHFLRFEDDGTSKGAVLAKVGAEHYLVEVLAWKDDGPSQIIILPVANMASRGCLEGFVFFRSAPEREAWMAEMDALEDEQEEAAGKVLQ